MPIIPKGPPQPRPLIPRSSSIDDELRAYIREQREADIKGSVDRLADLFMRHDAEDKLRQEEIKGDLRGISLRVGALEKRSEKQESEIDDSKSWIIRDLEKKHEHATGQIDFLKKHAFGIIASVIAAVSTLLHLFH